MFKDLPAVELAAENERLIEKLFQQHQDTLIENRKLTARIIEQDGEIAGLITKLELRKAETIRLADKITEYEKS